MSPFAIRKRPVESSAVRFNGDNLRDVITWVVGLGGEAYEGEQGRLYLVTDRGDAGVDTGDFVIRGLVGEFYPVTSAAFKAGWEVIER